MTAILDSKLEKKERKKKRRINSNTFIQLHISHSRWPRRDSSIEKHAIQTLSMMLKMPVLLNAPIALHQELLQCKPNYISELWRLWNTVTDCHSDRTFFQLRPLCGYHVLSSLQAKGTKSSLFLTYPLLMAYMHIGILAALSIGCSELCFTWYNVIFWPIRRFIAKHGYPLTFAYLFKNIDSLVKYWLFTHFFCNCSFFIFFWGLSKWKLHWVTCKVNESQRDSCKLC